VQTYDAGELARREYGKTAVKLVRAGFDPEWAHTLGFGPGPRTVTIVGKRQFELQIAQFLRQHKDDYDFELLFPAHPT